MRHAACPLKGYINGGLSASGIGDVVEAGVNVGGGVHLPLRAGHDDAHTRHFFILAVLATEVDVFQRYKPAGGDGGGAVSVLHHAAEEGGLDGAVGVGASHHVGHHGVGVEHVGAAHVGGGDVILGVAHEYRGALAFGKGLSGAFAQDLHVHAAAVEEYVFVARDIGGVALCCEVTLGYHVDAAGHVDAIRVGVRVGKVDAGIEKILYLLVFLLAAVGVSFFIVAGAKQTYGEEEKQE